MIAYRWNRLVGSSTSAIDLYFLHIHLSPAPLPEVRGLSSLLLSPPPLLRLSPLLGLFSSRDRLGFIVFSSFFIVLTLSLVDSGQK